MTEEQKNTMIAWLNDAHAMALSFIQTMEEHAKDAEKAGKPELKEAHDEHGQILRNHVNLLESCIKRLGGDPSLLKDTMGKTMGYVQGAMTSMYKDVMVKDALEMYAGIQFAIGAYESLVAAAEQVGDNETRDINARILEEDRKMAEWALDQIPIITQEHIHKLT